jgi:hypothetical protein
MNTFNFVKTEFTIHAIANVNIYCTFKSRLHSRVDEVSVLLGYDAVTLCNGEMSTQNILTYETNIQ